MPVLLKFQTLYDFKQACRSAVNFSLFSSTNDCFSEIGSCFDIDLMCAKAGWGCCICFTEGATFPRECVPFVAD